MEEKGVWRTVGGRRIFIKEGQSLSEAMKSSGKFGSKKATFKHKNVRTDEGFDNLPDDVKNTIIEQINELSEQYKDVFDNDIFTIQAKDLGDVGAYMTDNNAMLLNSEMLKSKEYYTKLHNDSVKDGYAQEVPKGKEVNSLIIHEFGHSYQNYLYRMSDLEDTISKTEFQSDFKTNIIKQAGQKVVYENTSGYSKETASEFFAENFLKNYYYPDDEMSKIFSKQLKEIKKQNKK